MVSTSVVAPGLGDGPAARIADIMGAATAGATVVGGMTVSTTGAAGTAKATEGPDAAAIIVGAVPT